MRAEGKVPVVVYGGGWQFRCGVGLIERAGCSSSYRIRGVNTVFSLDIDGEGVNGRHLSGPSDRSRKGTAHSCRPSSFDKGQKIEMTVPITLDGEPIGVTEEGGL